MTNLTTAITIVTLISVAGTGVELDGTEPAPPTSVPLVRASAPQSSPNIAATPPAGESADQARSPISVSATPTVTFVGADPDQRAAVDEALHDFRNAGLLLPAVEIRFFDDQAECDSHLGLFQARFKPWRILVCSDLDFVVTHELAHAWELANLDDDHRAGYLAARTLWTWDDHDAPWNERGVEDAAFVVQQNLTMTNAPLTSPTWQERVAAYELLTGLQSPLRPRRAECDEHPAGYSTI